MDRPTIAARRTLARMSISIPVGMSISLAIAITDGPAPAAVDDVTALTAVVSDDTSKVRVVYPDPTPGVTNPARSVRVDMLAGASPGSGANFHARYTSPYDGTIRNLSELAVAIRAPNVGSASFGTASEPFATPAS